jgi:hypothetical protein
MTEKHSFWSTMPGILTGLAGVISALGGLLLVLFQTGLLDDSGDKKELIQNGMPTKSVIPTDLEVIKENSKFARSVGGSALLTKSKQIPFSVAQEHRGTVAVYIDGKRDGMKIGWKLPVPNTDCSILLYNIEKSSGSFSFELRCGE